MIIQGEQEVMKLRQEFILSQSDIENLHNGIMLFENIGENMLLYIYNIFLNCEFNSIPYISSGVLRFYFEDMELAPYFESGNNSIIFDSNTLFSVSRKAGEVLELNKKFFIKSTEPITAGDGEIKICIEYNRIPT